MEQKISYYAIIPAPVRYDKSICSNAKLLYGEITALCNETGYCWAQNKYFAELYNVTTVTISKWISSLIKKGYVLSEIIYKDGTKEIEERRLSINPLNKSLIPLKQKFNTPVKEKFKDNTTEENNTSEYIKEKCKKENPEVFDIIAFWNERSVDDKCEGGKGSINAIKKALTKYTADEIKTAIDHYKQVINNDSYYYSYSWKIELFLVRQGGITEFFDDGSKWKNYLADKNKKKTATRPTASPDSDEAQREFHEDLKRYGLI